MTDFPSVPVVDKPDRALFENDIKPLNRPFVLKNLVAHWPCVTAARNSPQALAEWLTTHDNGTPVTVSIAPPHENGLFSYKDAQGFTFINQTRPLGQIVERLLNHPGRESLYVQGVPLDDHLPDAVAELDMPLLDPAVRPRLWIGNSVTAQTHFDLSANIACHVAGEKLFTLFPPEQGVNLYPGPTDVTPAGVPVSQVRLDTPDFERFPRFREALATAQSARLEPGDALYIPALWWHHVRTDGPLNMLVNYWWTDGRADLPSPLLGLYLAGLSFKHLPPEQRAVWRQLLDYYVFESHGDPLASLPGLPSLFQAQASEQQMEAFKTYFRSMLKL